MAKVKPITTIEKLHGKIAGNDSGYFYVRNDRLFYRNREEGYQKNQSPKQKYNSEVFAYANSYMAQNYGTPETKAQLKAEFEAAHHIATNGKTYATPWSWKFNSIQYEYKQSHPFPA